MSFHLDPRVTISQIVTLVVLVFASGGAYYQLGNLAKAMEGIATSVAGNASSIRKVESRTAVLESQRVDHVRRLDDIQSDVRWIRRAIEQREPPR